MTLAVGIDLGRRYVRGVIVDAETSTITIKKIIEVKIEDGDKSKALKDVLSALPMQAKLGISLPLESTIMRLVAFPFDDDLKIRETIKFKMESFLDGSLEDYLVDYYKINADAHLTNVMAFAKPISEIQELLDICQSCNCDPEQINLDVFSLANLFAKKHKKPDLIALVDVATDGCRIIVLQDSKISFIRGLRQGTHWLASYMATNANIDYQQAYQACFSTEVNPSLEAVRQRGLEELAGQIRRTLMSVQQEEYATIYITGEGSDIPAIDILFKKYLGEGLLTVSGIDGFKLSSDISEQPLSVDYAIALGEAITMADKSAKENLSINFRQEQCSYRGLEDKLKSQALLLAVLVGICAIVFSALNLKQYFALERNLASIQNQQIDIFTTVLPTKDPDFYVNKGLDLKSVLSGELRNLKEDLPSTSSSSGADTSTLVYIKDILLKIGKQAEIKIEYLNLNERGGNLRGWCGDFATAEIISSKISQVKGIKADKPIMRSKDAGVSFSIRLGVR